MDILTALSAGADYSTAKLQVILAAWVLGGVNEGPKKKISADNGDVAEEDYEKSSIYSLLYSLYRSMGSVRSDRGDLYELTFNTWGYAWPREWGKSPISARDPQRFGKTAYTGLFDFAAVKELVRAKEGRVHVVEMGCGTGAGAHHVCHEVLPRATYEAVDMQRAAINTCERKFVPTLGGRLRAIHADCTRLPVRDGAADLVAVCETHVTEHAGQCTSDDAAFLGNAHRVLKPGGYLVWGNAIPAATWKPCLDYLASIGMRLVEVRDVTDQAVAARDDDRARVDAYVEQCLERFHAFRIPFVGSRRKQEARLALSNFYRNPGTNMYETLKNGTDAYKVVALQKVA